MTTCFHEALAKETKETGFYLTLRMRLLLRGIASVVSAALSASLNTKSWCSLRIKPASGSHVPARATASEYPSWNTAGSRYKWTRLRNWCGCCVGSENLPETAVSFGDFGALTRTSISARSLCSGKFLVNSRRMGGDFSFKDSFPESRITEAPYDKLFCRAC